jgi:regulator of protease activity HflC (stomatin/prohibitin superfamily)
MLTLKYGLELIGFGLLAVAAGAFLHDGYFSLGFRPFLGFSRTRGAPVRWRVAAKLAAVALVPLLAGMSLTVVPAGMAGVRVSQVSGTLPGTLYPGAHLTIPLVQNVELYSTRDSLYTTLATPEPKAALDALRVQTREGLEVGLAVTVRYRVDPKGLHYIHATLPQPLDREVVPSVVATVFRELAPQYLVRELFSTKRAEVLERASQSVGRKLAADSIVVREVMIRDLVLPPEYAKGLEGLLLKEQENERLSVDIEVKQKMVRTAELEAEALKARQVKQAEAEAQTTVLEAKAQADAMQFTLPLKEKQIQQSRLEAEARKESTVKNAEAAAQAKVIDSRAELERRKLLAEADDHRARLLAASDVERLEREAQVFKENPLLIQKIIAERLSDKVQIMMVPTDGKFFFANDVLRSAPFVVPAATGER